MVFYQALDNKITKSLSLTFKLLIFYNAIGYNKYLKYYLNDKSMEKSKNYGFLLLLGRGKKSAEDKFGSARYLIKVINH
jgi:hypothetical protein